MSESEIQREILELLKHHPDVAYYFRHNVGRRHHIRFGVPGQSDILGMLHGGRFLAIEVKRPGEKRTDLQINFQDKINTAGGLAFVAESVEDVRSMIEEGHC